MDGAQTLTATIDDIAEWVEANIAKKLSYLVPADGGAVDTANNVRAHPTVFKLFVPSAERLAKGEHQAPSIAVQVSGTDGLKSSRELSVKLILTIWSPGIFEDGKFVRSMEGWRELFNGLGIIVSEVEAAETIAGCALDMNDGVTYGLYEIDREIPDLYPHWMGEVDFKLVRAPHANKRFLDIL